MYISQKQNKKFYTHDRTHFAVEQLEQENLLSSTEFQYEYVRSTQRKSETRNYRRYLIWSHEKVTYLYFFTALATLEYVVFAKGAGRIEV